MVPSCTLASADVDFMQGLLPFPLTHSDNFQQLVRSVEEKGFRVGRHLTSRQV